MARLDPSQSQQPRAAQPRPVQAGQLPQPARPVPAQAGRPIPAQAAKPSLRAENPEEEGEGNDDLDVVVRNAPPWLVSGIVHMLLLIILGLWVMASKLESKIDLEVIYADELGEQLEEENIELLADDEVPLEEQVITPDDLPEVTDPLAAPPTLDIAVNATTMTSDVNAPMIGLALNGRDKGMKKALLAAYGGTALTEAAVLEGLKWLVRNQKRNGSWSLIGPYTGEAYSENPEAATAMALLAFQGAGHTPKSSRDSPFRDAVTRGWNYLLKRQDRDGNFFHEGASHHRLYTQAQATIAICELYGMTKDKKYKEPAARAIEYAVNSQDREGGWRYNPGAGSDTSVTGWFVMALQSGKMAGLNVPETTLVNVGKFLDSVSSDGGRRYGYQGPGSARPSMTAEGLLCRQYLGWKQSDARLVDGTKHLLDNNMTWGDRNCYYWYYATQVTHHMGGSYWKDWNAVMRQLLPTKQVKDGKERGSWTPDGDQWGPHGGRLFVTCLHLYMLEVYYRHLPIYDTHLFMTNK